jgi:predicted double-glycine peptidase
MINLNPIRQSRGFCGPACFKMVMDHFGIRHPQMYWARLTAMKMMNGKVVRDEGCSDDKFVKTAKRMGFKGFCQDNSSIVELRKFVMDGIPVIVNWFSPEEGAHFSVIVGFEKDSVVLADPHFGEFRKHKISWFEERWFDHMPYPIKDLKQFYWVRRICLVHR